MNNEKNNLTQRVDQGIREAIFEAIAEHKKEGRSIAIEENGQVIILKPEEINLDEIAESIKRTNQK